MSEASKMLEKQPTERVPAELLAATELMWCRRAYTQQYKHGSAKYRNAEIEFFAGAAAALGALGYVPPPSWVFSIMRGDTVIKNVSDMRTILVEAGDIR